MQKDSKELYSVKRGLKIKDLDIQARRVKIVLSSFDTLDSDSDIIRKGAFKKSIEERGPNSANNRKIAFLRYHDWEHPIGKFVHLEETNEGLIGEAELGRSAKGDAAMLDYQDGIINEHSIGFNYIEDKTQLIERGDSSYWEIKEVQLWEGSAVTFGANSLTPTLDVSKGNHLEVIDKVNKKMTSLINALKNGKGTDERLFEIEMALKVCQQQYNSLVNFEPSVKGTQEDEPEIDVHNQDVKNFYLNILK